MRTFVLNLRGGDKEESVFSFSESPHWETINGEPVPRSVVVEETATGQGIVLVHGYNVDDAVPAYMQVLANLEGVYDWAILNLWPGSNKPGYWFAEKRADKAGLIIRDEFASLRCKPPDKEGHSCGCRVALEAVWGGMRVRHLILAAAAIDHETVHMDQRYGPAIAANAATCLVAHSRGDKVLKDAFRLSSWFKRAFRLRFWGDDCKALGYTGPQDPAKCPANLKAVNLNGAIDRHGAYKECEAFFEEWRKLAGRP